MHTFLNIIVPLSGFLRRADLENKKPSWVKIFFNGVLPTFFFFWLFSNIPVIGTLIYTVILIPLSAYFHIKEAKIKNEEEKIKIFLWYFSVIIIGFGSFWSFTGHFFLSELVAKQIGWLPGSPFQTELAFYHLGFAVAGLMSFTRKSFIPPLIIAKSIFWYGAAYVHIVDAIMNHNFSILNVGAPLIGDIVLPTIFLVLLYKSKILSKTNKKL